MVTKKKIDARIEELQGLWNQAAQVAAQNDANCISFKSRIFEAREMLLMLETKDDGK